MIYILIEREDQELNLFFHSFSPSPFAWNSNISFMVGRKLCANLHTVCSPWINCVCAPWNKRHLRMNVFGPRLSHGRSTSFFRTEKKTNLKKEKTKNRRPKNSSFWDEFRPKKNKTKRKSVKGIRKKNGIAYLGAFSSWSCYFSFRPRLVQFHLDHKIQKEKRQRAKTDNLEAWESLE